MTSELTVIFISFWVVLVIFSIWFFGINRNASRKRRYYPLFIISSYALFAMVLIAIGILSKKPEGPVYYIFIPALILIGYLNLKTTKFCDGCGRTVHNANWFTSMEYCLKCGSKLK